MTKRKLDLVVDNDIETKQIPWNLYCNIYKQSCLKYFYIYTKFCNLYEKEKQNYNQSNLSRYQNYTKILLYYQNISNSFADIFNTACFPPRKQAQINRLLQSESSQESFLLFVNILQEHLLRANYAILNIMHDLSLLEFVEPLEHSVPIHSDLLGISLYAHPH